MRDLQYETSLASRRNSNLILKLRINSEVLQKMSLLLSLLVGVFVLSSTAIARVEDFVSISVDEARFSPSPAKMKSMLGEADLKSHGFEEEEITRKRNDKNGDEFLSKTLFYFKVVSCSQASQTIQELKNLLPEALPSSILVKLMSDLKAQNTQGKQCRIGFTSDKENNRSKRHDPRARVKRGWRVRGRARIDIGCC
ncbi:uncharacterized protein LOC114967527 isoform X2 [Acropora millepora]|uniref:uncharacterized protein LOC114967527 isoform X2 n=1 Tax=Acropora millepora TaxID=45264 RepID=UPI001CF1C1B5|nr:uncharacterized protein LOC114967527 isoform X2 [Acropora millepora]